MASFVFSSTSWFLSGAEGGNGLSHISSQSDTSGLLLSRDEMNQSPE